MLTGVTLISDGSAFGAMADPWFVLADFSPSSAGCERLDPGGRVGGKNRLRERACSSASIKYVGQNWAQRDQQKD